MIDKFPTGTAMHYGRVIDVGLPARSDVAGPMRHTSEGRIPESCLTPILQHGGRREETHES